VLDRACAGDVPKKHHVAHRVDGHLHHEECLTRGGFEGAYSILYHRDRPHVHEPRPAPVELRPVRPAPPAELRKRHFPSTKLALPGGALVGARVPLFTNRDVTVWSARPTEEDRVYSSSGDADELVYVFEGKGVLRTIFGDLAWEGGDYVCVPRGVIHRWIPDGPCHLVGFDVQDLGLLRQWRNETGQLRMDAPYCHRDFRRPAFRGPLDEGIREIVVRRGGKAHGFALPHSPLDVVGWDGSVYPWAFPILSFQPRAGLVHLPPTWHGTFQARGLLVCSFVPRMLDFHPEAIPCPYPHSSVDCDELIFYCRGNFTSTGASFAAAPSPQLSRSATT